MDYIFNLVAIDATAKQRLISLQARIKMGQNADIANKSGPLNATLFC